MSKLLFTLLIAASAMAAQARQPFSGPDLSGVYTCTGNDDKEGEYKATVTLRLVSAQSRGQYGAYSFKLEVVGYGTYLGQAATHRNDMAIHFAHVDPATRDYGTGIARFSKNKAGKWSFRKFYYEPEFKGGNHGIEDCVMR